MTAECEDSLVRMRDLLEPIRASVEELIFAPGSSTLGSVTGLLSAVPVDLCERVGTVWADLTHRVTPGELCRQFSNEDRLLIDILLSMSDDRRHFESPTTDGVARVR